MWARGMTNKRRSEAETKVDAYWKEAKKYVKVHGLEWFAFDWQSDARWRWEQYFAWRLGFVPVGLNYLKRETIKIFLVPCEDPHEFDSKYPQPKEIVP